MIILIYLIKQVAYFKNNVMSTIIILLIAFGIIAYNTFAWAYVAKIFYGWFILPYFTTLPQFGTLQFVGFLMFIAVLTHKHSTNVKSEYKD